MSAPSQRTVMRGAGDWAPSAACAAMYWLMSAGSASMLGVLDAEDWNPLIGCGVDGAMTMTPGSGSASATGGGEGKGTLATAWLDQASNVARSVPSSMRICLSPRLI